MGDASRLDPAAADRERSLVAGLDHLLHGVLVLDLRGAIAALNVEGARLLGAPAESLRGRDFAACFAPASARELRAVLGRAEGATHLQITRGDDAGAAVLDAVLHPARGVAGGAGADPGGAREWVVHLADAHARSRDEREAGERAASLAFFADLADTVAGELNAERALGRALDSIARHLGVECAAVARVGAEGRAMALLSARGLSDDARARFVRCAEELRAELFAGTEPVAPPAALRDALAPGHEALLVPLRHAEWPVGAALFAAPALPPATRALLLSGARTIAVALHASIEYDAAVAVAAQRRQLLDSIPTLVFRLDPRSGATLYVNAAVERVLGVPAGEVIGQPGLEALLRDDAERDAMAQARAEAAVGVDAGWIDRIFAHRDGRARVLRTRLYRVVDAPRGDDAAMLLEGIAQDVTDELEARKQLVHADRLASLGTLAAGVAHEINNPAAFISLGVQQLARSVAQLPDQPDTLAQRRRMNDVIAELSDGIQRIVQIVGELKLFARIPEGSFSTPVDVNRLIVSAVTLARAELRHRARVEIDLGELPPLPGDHARLGQVFVNLLINAAQAIQPGDEEHNLVRVATRALEGAVVVEVSDTGVGIPPEVLPRIFDPFFTTKAPSEGTGLGLAISYDLVRRAGGSIDVASEVGRGTRFTVKLPVRDFVPARGSRPRITPVPLGGRVLVVDDEHHLTVAIARALAATYMVEMAADAPTALARIEGTSGGEGGDFDAVLCDLRLPGMDGAALYESVRARWPAQAARFVFLTGASLDSRLDRFVKSTGLPMLEKPFEMSELEALVAQIVHSKRAATPGPR